MSVNLARSFFLWHLDDQIGFQLVTDIPDNIPADVRNQVELITVAKGEIGEGFSTKLQLDRLVSEGQTLFIDADCLIYRNLDFIFDFFDGRAVSVVGGYISDGEWFGDVRHICTRYGISAMPKFNGGVYYLEKGECASSVFETARLIEKEYDEAGFVRLRNRPNDEVILSVAMALHRQIPVPDDGSMMAEFVNFQSGVKSDLMKGKAILYNCPRHAKYQSNWHLTKAEPAIVHFLGYHTQVMPYVKEVRLLRLIVAKKLSRPMAGLLTFFSLTAPLRLIGGARDVLRPLYRRFFGVRPIKRSERMVD